MVKKIFVIILKLFLKNRSECIGSFYHGGQKYCIYVAKYGLNSDAYQDNLNDLLNSSVNGERWKKAFIKL